MRTSDTTRSKGRPAAARSRIARIAEVPSANSVTTQPCCSSTARTVPRIDSSSSATSTSRPSNTGSRMPSRRKSSAPRTPRGPLAAARIISSTLAALSIRRAAIALVSPSRAGSASVRASRARASFAMSASGVAVSRASWLMMVRLVSQRSATSMSSVFSERAT